MSILPDVIETESETLLESLGSNILIGTDGDDRGAGVMNFSHFAEEIEKNEDLRQRKEFFLDPKNQADILFMNYMMSNPGIIMTGQEKRNLKRTFLARAKKGKYRNIFLEVAERNIDSEDDK